MRSNARRRVEKLEQMRRAAKTPILVVDAVGMSAAQRQAAIAAKQAEARAAGLVAPIVVLDF